MLMLMLRTHMEMTLCLRQCYHRSRRLARCNQASWLLSDGRAGVGAATTAQCPRHSRHHHHHHYRSLLVRCCWTRQVWVLRHRRRRPARCRQLPSTSAGVTDVAVAEEVPAAPRLQLQWRCLRRRRRQRRPVPAAGGGRGCAGWCLQSRWARYMLRAAEGLAVPAPPPPQAVEAASGLLVVQERPTGAKKLPPPSLRLELDENCHNSSTLSCLPPPRSCLPPHGLASLSAGSTESVNGS